MLQLDRRASGSRPRRPVHTNSAAARLRVICVVSFEVLGDTDSKRSEIHLGKPWALSALDTAARTGSISESSR
jgi:hypothetical protein